MIASMFSFWTLCMYINIESLVNMFSMYFLYSGVSFSGTSSPLPMGKA